MSPVPEGAQLSPDGYYWWDEAGQLWQPVDGQDGQGGQDAQDGQGGQDGQAGDAGGQAGQGAAAFVFEGPPAQLGVSDENDGPLPVANAETKVSFGAVWNVGTAAGVATVHVLVDGSEVQSWQSPQIGPQQSAEPDDGFVHNCGAYPVGHHDFVARLDDTANGYPSEVSNGVDLGDG